MTKPARRSRHFNNLEQLVLIRYLPESICSKIQEQVNLDRVKYFAFGSTVESSDIFARLLNYIYA